MRQALPRLDLDVIRLLTNPEQYSIGCVHLTSGYNSTKVVDELEFSPECIVDEDDRHHHNLIVEHKLVAVEGRPQIPRHVPSLFRDMGMKGFFT